SVPAGSDVTDVAQGVLYVCGAFFSYRTQEGYGEQSEHDNGREDPLIGEDGIVADKKGGEHRRPTQRGYTVHDGGDRHPSTDVVGSVLRFGGRQHQVELAKIDTSPEDAHQDVGRQEEGCVDCVMAREAEDPGDRVESQSRAHEPENGLVAVLVG